MVKSYFSAEVLHLSEGCSAGDCISLQVPCPLEFLFFIPQLTLFASVGKGEVALPLHFSFLLHKQYEVLFIYNLNVRDVGPIWCFQLAEHFLVLWVPDRT